MGKIFLHLHHTLLREIDLEPGKTTIGRKSSNSVVLSDPTVSASHARITLSGGEATLEDLNSTNGTFVNEVRISSVQLKDGDNIGIGNYRLGYVAEDAGSETNRTPTQILRLDSPGMPPGPVDERSTSRIRKWRAERTARKGGNDDRVMRLRILSGVNQGRHLDLISPVTAVGEPGREVIILIREGPVLLLREVLKGESPVLVNDKPLGSSTRPLRHNDTIQAGDTRMIVVVEPAADQLGAGTEDWSLE
ncbi:MAG TPA: FHA domain-containing protein [Thioalkalivibrio sp.]|nr:FHA domain-containing protein [Thioalkalivibrio sp.]